MQAEFYGANCCGQAFFGNIDGSYFISYCALYKIEEKSVAMPIMDDG
jgi:hypothetical protein|tara:strand:- start:55 stop:195 length:141 start_codon:yes stop_codon:yes gene_type:complete